MTGTSRSKQVIDRITQAAKQAEEQQQESVSPDSAQGKRDRTWDRLNKATPIRLQDSDVQWLHSFADEHNITVSTAGRELIRTMRQAVKQGWVNFTIEQEIEEFEDTLGRQRTRVHTELKADWQIPRP